VLAEKGLDDFYRGSIAEQILADMAVLGRSARRFVGLSS